MVGFQLVGCDEERAEAGGVVFVLGRVVHKAHLAGGEVARRPVAVDQVAGDVLLGRGGVEVRSVVSDHRGDLDLVVP
jgi:hypothetical protein